MSRILSYGQFHANTPNPPGQQLKLPGMEHIAHAHPTLETSRSFLRFGSVPEGERSRNHATGGMEDGVSAYEMHPHTNMPMDPDPDWEHPGSEWALDGMQNRVREHHRNPDNPHVAGQEIKAKDVMWAGHDGEPLLLGVQHHRDWDGGAARRHDYWNDRREQY